MKLSLKELELLAKGLRFVACCDNPLRMRITEKIHVKRRKTEIKKVEKQIEIAKEYIKGINKIFENNKKEETLEDLVNSISAICGIDSNISRDEYIVKTILTISTNELKDGELERIIKVKNAGHNIFIKLVD